MQYEFGLEEQGLLERRACKNDRRVNLVHLTEAAGPVLAEITRIVTQTRLEIIQDIKPDEMAVALSVITRILNRLEPCDPHAAGEIQEEGNTHD